MGDYTIFYVFENPRRGRQARNFTTNVPKILDLKSSSEQILSENWRWVPLCFKSVVHDMNGRVNKLHIEWINEWKRVKKKDGSWKAHQNDAYFMPRLFATSCCVLVCDCPPIPIRKHVWFLRSSPSKAHRISVRKFWLGIVLFKRETWCEDQRSNRAANWSLQRKEILPNCKQDAEFALIILTLSLIV